MFFMLCAKVITIYEKRTFKMLRFSGKPEYAYNVWKNSGNFCSIRALIAIFRHSGFLLLKIIKVPETGE